MHLPQKGRPPIFLLALSATIRLPLFLPSILFLFFAGYYQYTPQVSIASDPNDPLAVEAGGIGRGAGHERRSSSFDISPSAAARSLLSKLSVRKPSILSISSNASSPGAPGGHGDRKNSTNGSQEELFLRRE